MAQNTPAGWSGFADKYMESVEPATSPFADVMARCAASLALSSRGAGPIRVIDLACGPGNSTEAVAAALPRDSIIDATDFAPHMVELAKLRMGARVRNAFVADAMALPQDVCPDGSYDLVTSCFGIMLVPDRAKAIREVMRVLRPGGAFAVTCWNAAPGCDKWGMDLIGAMTNDAAGKQTDPAQGILPNPETFVNMFSTEGFKQVECRPVTCTGVFRDTREIVQCYMEIPIFKFVFDGLRADPAKYDAFVTKWADKIHEMAGHADPVTYQRSAFVIFGRKE